MSGKLGFAICSAVIALLAATGPSFAQQKTVKVCEEEWRANKTANQAAHVTEKAYVEKCRAGGDTAAQPAAPPAAAPAATKTTAAPATAKPAATTGVGTPAGAGQFQTEAQAKSSCAGDTVVWANLKSKVYHFAGHKDYGATKSGAYMCEKSTSAAGFRAAKNEKHP